MKTLLIFQAASAWSLFNDVMIAELGVITFYSTYESDIVKYDICNVTVFELSAHADLNLAQTWTNQAAQLFLDSWQSSGNATTSVQRALAWVESAFANKGGNNCAHAENIQDDR